MKKNIFKKAFAGIMAAALVMTSATFTAKTAYADDVINTSTAVSLTIHKYEFNGTPLTTTRTGTTADAPTGLTGATPLDGVTFTVYKIADVAQGETTTPAATTIQYNVTDTTIQGFLGKSTLYGNSDESATIAALTETGTDNFAKAKTGLTGTAVVTGANGVEGEAKFTGLAQGLYLVVETAAPAKVTGRTAPFLVSLPMTTADGSEWLYDVHAYPKNKTSTNDITLAKNGRDLGTTTSAAIAGAKFKIERTTSPANVSSVWADVTSTLVSGSTEITVPVEGITVSGLEAGYEYRFVEIAAPNKNYIADAVRTYNFKVEQYVEDGENKTRIVAVDGTTITSNTITVENEKPTVEKKVATKKLDKSAAKVWADQADYSTGDDVPFKATITVPTTLKKLQRYTVTDTYANASQFGQPKNFTYKFYTKTAEITDAETVAAIKTAIGNPTSTSTGWTWNLATAGAKTALVDNNVEKIEVYYDAELTASAETVSTATLTGNKNGLSLEFSNKTTNDGDGDETTTIYDEVVVYTFGLELVKTFEGSAPSATVNATFDLYRVAGKNADGTDETSVDIPGTSPVVKGVKIGAYTTDATGRITFSTTEEETGNKKAFSNGTYYFVETKTAAGYNLLKEAVPVTINKVYTKIFQTKSNQITSYTADGVATVTTDSVASGTESTTFYTDSTKATPITYAVTSKSVINRKGFTLPVTGGKGTILFTVIGLVLMAAAVVGFFASKKRKANA